MRRHVCILILFAVATALVACGGGGGGGGGPAIPVTPAPTVTLSAAPASIPAGGTVQMTWSSTNATSCTGSGAAGTGWEGSRPASGSASIGPFNSTTVLTLTCNGTGGSGQSTTTVNVTRPPGSVSGRVTFARIPFRATLGAGLDYAATRQDPARGVTVEAVNAGNGEVIVSTSTDGDGNFSLLVTPGLALFVRVKAEMLRAGPQAPNWHYRVLSPRAGNQVYAYSTVNFVSQAAGVFSDIAIPSGWSTSGQLTGTRHAAPFAILDTVYRIQTVVLGVAPAASFPALTLDWSETNPAGETFYSRAGNLSRIVLPGMAGIDTQEYDAHVVGHEFGHYIVDHFSRGDSPGGPHGAGDRLDPTLAFNEGFATAFAALTLGDPVMRDSFGANQANDGYFNVENNTVPGEPGWFSEGSVWAAVLDLFDTANEPSGDGVSLGFAELWHTLTGPMIATDALTTIFPFVAALKQRNPAQAAQIDTIVNRQSIDSGSIDDYGSTETHNAGSPDVLPLYTGITVNGPTRTLRSVNTFGTPNKLANSRFLRLDLPVAQFVRFRITAAAGRDPDVRVWRRGVVVSGEQGPADEDFTLNLAAGTYILEIFDCGNAGCNPGVAPGLVDITVRLTSS